MSFNDELYDLTYEDDGQVYHAIGKRGTLNYGNPLYGERDFYDFLKDVGDIVHDDDAFIYIEIGFVDFNYVDANLWVSYQGNIKTYSMCETAIQEARKLCGNEDFKPHLAKAIDDLDDRLIKGN